MSAHENGGRGPERPLRKRDGERIRLEHESTLSLDWETHHGGSEATRVDDTLRALHDASDEHEIGIEPETDFDRTAIDPALATLRGADSPHIAPKRGGRRASDEGLRFSGASLSYGHIVVVERRDLAPGMIEIDDDATRPEGAPSKTADRLLVALGAALAIAGVAMFLL